MRPARRVTTRGRRGSRIPRGFKEVSGADSGRESASMVAVPLSITAGLASPAPSRAYLPRIGSNRLLKNAPNPGSPTSPLVACWGGKQGTPARAEVARVGAERARRYRMRNPEVKRTRSWGLILPETCFSAAC
jgi:hypothetical protein